MKNPSPQGAPLGNQEHIAKAIEIVSSTAARLQASQDLHFRERVKDWEKWHPESIVTHRREATSPEADPVLADIYQRAARIDANTDVAEENRRTWGEWRRAIGGKLDLRGADFSGLDLLGFTFDDADMAGVSFAGASLYKCRFSNANLEQADFSGAAIQGVTVSKSRLVRANFSNSKLKDVSLDTETDLSDTTFGGCTIVPGVCHDWPELFRSRLSKEQRKQMRACIVATAVCRDAQAPEVIALRQFRDKVLVRYDLGRRCIEAYYRMSPSVAELVSRSTVARLVLRACVIRPLAQVRQ
jgi:hypothetical protein